MRKLILFLGAAALLALAACSKESDKKIAIAILTPVTHPSLEQIEKGFVETIEKAHPGKYRFTTYNAQGNKTLMRSELDAIIREDHSLIFTIGTNASQMAAEILPKRGIITPVVFTCVNDPVGFNIVSDEKNPGKQVTGVKELLNFSDELNALLKVKPDLKQVMLVYNPLEPGLHKDQIQIAKILEENNIGLILVEVFQTNELFAKVSPFMEKADALIVLKDNTVVSGLDLLVKLCNRHKIPLMASDLDSPDRGAALGYGVHEIEFGIEGAKKALQILEEGLKPGQIAVTPVDKFTLRVNKEAAKLQGIDEERL